MEVPRRDVHRVVAAPVDAVRRAGQAVGAAVLLVGGGARLAADLAVAVRETSFALEPAGTLVARRGPVVAPGAVRRRRAGGCLAVGIPRFLVRELIEPEDPAAPPGAPERPEHARDPDKYRRSEHGPRVPRLPEGSKGV
jgi:hypothetical protein